MTHAVIVRMSPKDAGEKVVEAELAGERKL